MSGASVDSSCLTTTLNGAFDKTRSNSLSTRGCGERMQTVIFELRLVATMCQPSQNCPKGQVSWKGLFSNCYVTGRVLLGDASGTGRLELWSPRRGECGRACLFQRESAAP